MLKYSIVSREARCVLAEFLVCVGLLIPSN